MNALVIQIAQFGIAAFAGVLFLAQVLAREIGVWLGRRRAAERKPEAEGVGVIVGGMLGLLAFVLALTLSFSSARFQERRDGTLQEANAIGTAWLRAEAIDHPRAAAVARLLETYAPVRRDYVSAPLDSVGIAALDERTGRLQAEIWGHVAALVRERPDPVAASLMAAVNDVFDTATAERMAFNTGMPPSLFWMLIGMTLASMGALGYQLGLRGLRLRQLSFVLIAMWTVVMTVILDLGSPRLGNVRTGSAVYDWTIEGFRGGTTIPPLPQAR
ncbi:hypothetical protein DFH01_22240 [Falsiroseomonas bella]|uniref:DUF4239 domain-containing protein n=1 Tax=Falsiroseomonas bella TaxID=2184016 RepID=A0A317F8B9_9PROT|nr:hypothetical protein DFH01_22240 [Falsiroseomonas bella]